MPIPVSRTWNSIQSTGLVRITERGKRDRPVPRELAGIAEKVEQDLPHLGQIAVDRADLVGAAHHESVASLLGQRGDGRRDAIDHGPQLEGLEIERHLAGFDLGKIEDVVDQAEQMLAGILDLAQVRHLRFAPGTLGVLEQDLAVTDDRVQGRAQLMAHAGDEVRLRAGRLLARPDRLVQLAFHALAVADVGEARDHRRAPFELDALRGHERPELLASGPLEQHLHALHMAVLGERADEALAMLRVCVEGFRLQAQGGRSLRARTFR